MLILTLLQAQPAAPNPFGTVFMFGAIFLIFYFLLIRPQRKQQKAHDEMVKTLSRGDEVVTIGGIVGKIIHLTDDRVTIKTAEDTRVEIERAKVGRKAGPAQDG
ncbi:MAG: preprotein translocase subunit YajC [marine benthic group bacterium]|nr:preprotein translocase subunit YajC [Candidatus Benthicola marisminoris]